MARLGRRLGGLLAGALLLLSTTCPAFASDPDGVDPSQITKIDEMTPSFASDPAYWAVYRRCMVERLKAHYSAITVAQAMQLCAPLSPGQRQRESALPLPMASELFGPEIDKSLEQFNRKVGRERPDFSPEYGRDAGQVVATCVLNEFVRDPAPGKEIRKRCESLETTIVTDGAFTEAEVWDAAKRTLTQPRCWPYGQQPKVRGQPWLEINPTPDNANGPCLQIIGPDRSQGIARLPAPPYVDVVFVEVLPVPPPIGQPAGPAPAPSTQATTTAVPDQSDGSSGSSEATTSTTAAVVEPEEEAGGQDDKERLEKKRRVQDREEKDRKSSSDGKDKGNDADKGICTPLPPLIRCK